MTEIRVERKERSALPWVLVGVVLLALLAWWIFARSPDDGPLGIGAADTAAPAGAGTAAGALPTAAEVFVQWVDDRRAQSAMGPEHEYTATGIRHLASALQAIAQPNAGANVERELAAIRAQADTLQRNAASTQHANYTRRAFVSLGALMSSMQQERFPDAAADVEEVRRRAEAVRADQPLLDQRAGVQEFFDRAAAAVRRMSEGGGGAAR